MTLRLCIGPADPMQRRRPEPGVLIVLRESFHGGQLGHALVDAVLIDQGITGEISRSVRFHSVARPAEEFPSLRERCCRVWISVIEARLQPFTVHLVSVI